MIDLNKLRIEAEVGEAVSCMTCLWIGKNIFTTSRRIAQPR